MSKMESKVYPVDRNYSCFLDSQVKSDSCCA